GHSSDPTPSHGRAPRPPAPLPAGVFLMRLRRWLGFLFDDLSGFGVERRRLAARRDEGLGGGAGEQHVWPAVKSLRLLDRKPREIALAHRVFDGAGTFRIEA